MKNKEIYHEVSEREHLNRLGQNFTQAPKNKTEIALYAENLKEQILSGNIDVLDAKIIIKSFSEMLKTLENDKKIKEAFQIEAEKYGKTFELKGHKFSLSSRKTYDFSVCSDSEWEKLNLVLKNAKEKLKEREALLKTLKAPIANPVTGELIGLPATKTTDILSITLKK